MRNTITPLSVPLSWGQEHQSSQGPRLTLPSWAFTKNVCLLPLLRRPRSSKKYEKGLTQMRKKIEQWDKGTYRQGKTFIVCSCIVLQFTKRIHWFSLTGGFLKNRLVIGLGSLHVLAQRQKLMTSGPYLGIFILLQWPIESEGRKGTGLFSPQQKSLWYQGVGKKLEYSIQSLNHVLQSEKD